MTPPFRYVLLVRLGVTTMLGALVLVVGWLVERAI